MNNTNKNNIWTFIDPQIIKATAIMVLTIMLVGGIVLVLGIMRYQVRLENISCDLMVQRARENAELINRNIIEYNQLIYSLAEDDDIERLRNWYYYDDSERIERYFRATERINNVITYDPNILTIYVCYPSSNLVFSSGLYNLSNFSVLSSEEQSQIKNYSINVFLSTQPEGNQRKINSLRLAAVVGLSIKTGGFITMELSPDFIISILETTRELNGEVVCLVDDSKNVIYCRGDLNPNQWNDLIDGINGGENSIQKTTEYFITWSKLDQPNWQYYIAIPRAYIAKESHSTTGITLIIIAISLLALCLGAIVSHYIFRPFEKLYKFVLGRSSTPQQINRIDYLSCVFDRLLGENKNLKEITDKNLPLLREKVLIQMVIQQEPTYTNPKHIQELGLKFEFPCFYITIITYQFGRDTMNGTKLVQVEILREFWLRRLSIIGVCHVVLYIPNQFLIVINQKENSLDELQLEHWFNEQALLFKQEFNGIITGGISKKKYNINELNIAFREAQRTLERQLLIGPGYINSYSEHKNHIKIVYPVDLTESLINATLSSSKDSLVSILKKIKDQIITNPPSSEFIMKQTFLYIISMVQQRLSIDFGDELIELYENSMELILSAHDLNLYMDTLTTYINGIDEFNSHYLKDQQHIQACRIRDYLQSNYSIPLTHDSIAEHFQISIPYLYKIMKEELGITPGCYLNTIRAKEAARLLKSSDLLVRDIGIRCGYETERSFFRNFKKQYGCTPSRFRSEWTKSEKPIK